MLKKTDVEGRAFDHHKHIKNKTAKIKATWGFLIFRLDKPSFFRGFDENRKVVTIQIVFSFQSSPGNKAKD